MLTYLLSHKKINRSRIEFGQTFPVETLHRPSLTLVCDSRGKDLANLLDTRVSDDFLVFSHILPGAPLHSAFSHCTIKNSAQIKNYTKKIGF